MKVVPEQIGANSRRFPLEWARRILERKRKGDATVTPLAVEKAKAALAGTLVRVK